MNFENLINFCIEGYAEISGETVEYIKIRLREENGDGPVTNSLFMLACDQMTIK